MKRGGDRPCGHCAQLEAKSCCSKCRQVRYCSRECQLAHWPKHRVTCNQARKLNAASALTKHVYEEEIARFGYFGFLESIDAVALYNHLYLSVLSTWEDITPLRGDDEAQDADAD